MAAGDQRAIDEAAAQVIASTIPADRPSPSRTAGLRPRRRKGRL